MASPVGVTVRASLPDTLVPGQAPSALAPMQDVTSLPYMQVVASCGPPDYFFTEYFRVHEHSRLEPHILRSITENESGRPVFAQLIGERPDDLRRTVRDLLPHPVAGIDLNMGCPAPKVYKKNVGGGLLRNLADADRALGVLREAVPGLFTVKMRVGFEDDSRFDELLGLIEKHEVDLLSLHTRLVRDGYRGPARHAYGKRAVGRLSCPVLLNGDLSSAARAVQLLQETGAHGVMIGRAAIRNPWIFRQLCELQAGQPPHRPTLADVHRYLEQLYDAFDQPEVPEAKQVARMKKFLNFVGLGVDGEGRFLHQVRRAKTRAELFGICSRHLLEEGRGELPFPDEPFPGLVARPNREGPAQPVTVTACS
ncbi:MAG: tRNA-dihydrouridine synthase family protein [Opitutales bacterium]